MKFKLRQVNMGYHHVSANAIQKRGICSVNCTEVGKS